jgi:hypothetical protein
MRARAALLAVAVRLVRSSHEPDAPCASCGMSAVEPPPMVSAPAAEIRADVAVITLGLLGLPADYIEMLTAHQLAALAGCIRAEQAIRADEWSRAEHALASDAQAWVREGRATC